MYFFRNMAYAVVTFLDDNTVNEIPTNWLNKDDKTLCWWPPTYTKNVSSLIQKRIEPDFKTWLQIPISIEKYCGTLQKARKVAEYENYTSTDEIVLGKGHRKKVVNKVFSFDSSNSSEECDKDKRGNQNDYSQAMPSQGLPSKFMRKKDTEDTATLTLSSSLLSNDATKKRKEQVQSKKRYTRKIPTKDIHKDSDSDENNSDLQDDISNIPIPQWPSSNTFTPNEHPPVLPSSNRNLSQASNMTEDTVNKRDQLLIDNTTIIIKMVAKLQVQMKDIKQRIEKITPTIKITCSTERVSKCFPLKTINDIKHMETRLEDEDFLKEYKVFLQKIGGHTPKGNIHNALTKIFSNECCLECSWKGRRQNFAIYKLRMIAVMKEVLLELHSTLTEKELDDIAAEWFRFAKQRCNRELMKNTKQQ